MIVFPDSNVETEYTDPNGSVWEFNGTGWVRQCDCSGGDGGDGGSGDPYWDHVKCQMQFEGGFSSDVGTTAYTLAKDGNATVKTDKAKHGLYSMYCDGQNTGITTKFKDGDFFNSAWTMETWFRPQYNTGKSWMLGMDDGASNRSGWKIWQSDLNLQFQVRSGNSNVINEITTSKFAMPNNAFSHIAVSYDGGLFRVFVNGKMAINKVYTGNTFTHADLKLGGRHTYEWGSSNNPRTQGWFDDFRVTGACRYTGDFEPPGELPQSAFAYFDKELGEIDQGGSNDADLSDLTNDVTTEES